MIRIAAFMVAVVFLVAGCGNRTSEPSQSSGASGSSAVSSSGVVSGQSSVFFPQVDTYGMTVSQSDRDRLAELYALRQIDPCGFVDQQTLARNGHPDYSYTYTGGSFYWGGYAAPIGGGGCKIVFPRSPVRVSIGLIPGDSTGLYQFWYSPVVSQPGITQRGDCAFRVEVPLASSPGAPPAMRNPQIGVSGAFDSQGYKGSPSEDEQKKICPLVKAVAFQIAQQLRVQGVPTHQANSTAISKFLTGDPCAAAARLGALSFNWWVPNIGAQYTSTWRHPSVCYARLNEKGAGAGGRALIYVKHGLIEWSDSDLSQFHGMQSSNLSSDSPEGVELYLQAGEKYCVVLAKAKKPIVAVTVGNGQKIPEVTPVMLLLIDKGAIPGSKVDCKEAKEEALTGLNPLR